MESIRRALRPLPSLLIFLSVFLLFVAERLVGEGDARTPVLVAAGLSFVIGVALRLAFRAGAPPPARRFTLAQLAAYAGIGVGAALYFAHLAVDDKQDERLRAMALVASLLVLFIHLVTLGALELVGGRMREAGFVEMLRVRQATATAVTVSFALSALVFLSFAANQRDFRTDLSYGAPTTPSAATRSLLEASQREVEVFLFFERGSPVLTEVGDYFDALSAKGVTTRVLDQALDPELAKELKVSRNGTIALKSGERSQTFFVGSDRDAARRKLGKFDEEIRSRLSKLTRDEKTVYFTVGHGERDAKRGKKEERPGAERFGKLIEALNAKTKKLGLAEGLGSAVPDDADLVIVHGPTSAFLPEEAATLKAYVERGGALMLLLDPRSEHGLDAVLEVLGLKASAAEVLNDKEYVRMSHTDADHAVIFSTSFTSHRAVRALNEARGRAALLFLQAGHLERAAEKTKAKVTFIARSRAGTFPDADGDRAFDDGEEKRGVLDLAAAVELAREGGEEARAIVVADSDVLADQLTQNEANAAFGYEGLLWLLRDDVTSGSVESNEDVPIRHTRDEDTLWFYGTTFAAPLAVLALGLTFIRVKRRRRRSA